jgi:hypothetical protein
MTPAATADGRSRNLILAAMIFAVSMTFIDQTIISIAAPHIQRELGLSATGVQSLTALGVPTRQAAAQAARIAQSQGGGPAAAAIPRFVRLDFAHASQTVLLVMAGIMAAAALTAVTGLRQGRQQEPGEAQVAPAPRAPQEEITTRP